MNSIVSYYFIGSPFEGSGYRKSSFVTDDEDYDDADMDTEDEDDDDEEDDEESSGKQFQMTSSVHFKYRVTVDKTNKMFEIENKNETLVSRKSFFSLLTFDRNRKPQSK